MLNPFRLELAHIISSACNLVCRAATPKHETRCECVPVREVKLPRKPCTDILFRMHPYGGFKLTFDETKYTTTFRTSDRKRH